MYDVARSVEVRCGGFHLYFCVLVFSFSMCDSTISVELELELE